MSDWTLHDYQDPHDASPYCETCGDDRIAEEHRDHGWLCGRCMAEVVEEEDRDARYNQLEDEMSERGWGRR